MPSTGSSDRSAGGAYSSRSDGGGGNSGTGSSDRSAGSSDGVRSPLQDGKRVHHFLERGLTRRRRTTEHHARRLEQRLPLGNPSRVGGGQLDDADGTLCLGRNARRYAVVHFIRLRVALHHPLLLHRRQRQVQKPPVAAAITKVLLTEELIPLPRAALVDTAGGVDDGAPLKLANKFRGVLLVPCEEGGLRHPWPFDHEIVAAL